MGKNVLTKRVDMRASLITSFIHTFFSSSAFSFLVWTSTLRIKERGKQKMKELMIPHIFRTIKIVIAYSKEKLMQISKKVGRKRVKDQRSSNYREQRTRKRHFATSKQSLLILIIVFLVVWYWVLYMPIVNAFCVALQNSMYRCSWINYQIMQFSIRNFEHFSSQSFCFSLD